MYFSRELLATVTGLSYFESQAILIPKKSPSSDGDNHAVVIGTFHKSLKTSFNIISSLDHPNALRD
jgi:hypothetical protein